MSLPLYGFLWTSLRFRKYFILCPMLMFKVILIIRVLISSLLSNISKIIFPIEHVYILAARDIAVTLLQYFTHWSEKFNWVIEIFITVKIKISHTILPKCFSNFSFYMSIISEKKYKYINKLQLKFITKISIVIISH